jgi:phenylalanyl-tRNA synthetase beta chain
MPTITVDRKVFEKLVGKRIPDDRLKDRISYLGTDLESVDAKEITAEIFPNRPDMLSVQGFARAFSTFIGHRKGLRHYIVKDSGEEVIIDKSVAKVRPYTACAIVRGINYDDATIKEVIDIQEKLHITFGRHRRKIAIGIYPFEKIKPPIRFLARKPEDISFQPLEFPRKINGKQILSQHPTGREYGYLLEGCSAYPIFIDANDQILSMPPIINSHNTGKISGKTTDVFIECSGFDFSALQKCLNMIVTAMADMGGQVFSMKLRYPDRTVVTPNLEPAPMGFDVNYVNKWLGTDLTRKQIEGLLQQMGYGIRDGKALVPAYRADIIHQTDLIEDIAIAYGYDRFEDILPNVATVGQEAAFEVFKNKVADLLAGLGLLETSTYHLTSKDHQCRRMNTEVPLIPLANALSSEYDMLRAWVIPSMMGVLASNKHNDYPQNIFGTGAIFKKKPDNDTNITEHERLAVALCSDSADYTAIRQVLDYLLRSIDVEYSVEDTEHASFIPGRVGRVSTKGKNVAYIGEIHPQVLENWDLEMPVACFELNLTELYGLF